MMMVQCCGDSDQHGPYLELAMVIAFRWGLSLCLLSLAPIAAMGQNEKTTAKKKPVENPAYAAVVDMADLPRVLLIGDSISIGYTLPVRELLRGKANVHRPATNCGPTTRGVQSIDQWLGNGKWDVIHFNFGLHDLKYVDEAGKNAPPDKGHPQVNESDYEKNLETIVVRMKKTGAKLIFATTTPVPPGADARIKGTNRNTTPSLGGLCSETVWQSTIYMPTPKRDWPRSSCRPMSTLNRMGRSSLPNRSPRACSRRSIRIKCLGFSLVRNQRTASPDTSSRVI